MTTASPIEADTMAFADVERFFHAQINEQRLHPGAQLVISHRGCVVLDLAAGLADAQLCTPVEPSTLFPLLSAGKPLASVALLQQVERDAVGLDDLVAAAIGPMLRAFNGPVLGAPWPVCAVSTARDMARFYAALLSGGTLDGATILRPETVERALQVEVDGALDQIFKRPVRWGLGFQLGGSHPNGQEMGATSTERTFGHGGGGLTLFWADRDLEVALAFTTNGALPPDLTAQRRQAISDAVRAACSSGVATPSRPGPLVDWR